MKYPSLLLSSLITFAFLSFLTISVVVYSQRERPRVQVGSPVCEIVVEESSVRTAHLRCSYSGPVLEGCSPTDPLLQRKAMSERKPAREACEFTQRMICNSNTSASYSYYCSDNEEIGGETGATTCPVSCYKNCSTPDSPKPCSRAIWDTTYCEWNRSRCLIAGGGDCTTPGWDGSCPPGTAYDYGSGMCCSDSGGGMCGLVAPLDGEQSANLLPDPSCCSDSERSACEAGGIWDEASCTCHSPIIIDIAGNGFNLTNANNGVLFDLTNDGTGERLSWTAANSDDAFLVLDRNNNGTIDNGRELFGDSALQPPPKEDETKNGFRALAIYDTQERGGNNDNQIDSNDAVFSRLQLWRDSNHNATSEADELQNLSESDVRIIELDYKESRQRDEYGNWFRFRAKVKDARGAKVNRWAWDVFLQTAK